MPVTTKKIVSKVRVSKRNKKDTLESSHDDDTIAVLRSKRGGRSVCHLNDFDNLDLDNGNTKDSYSISVDSSMESGGENLFSLSSKEEGAQERKVAKNKREGARGRAPPQCARSEARSVDISGSMNDIKDQTTKYSIEKNEGSCGEKFRIVDEAARKRRRQAAKHQQPSDPPKNLSRRMAYKIRRHAAAFSPVISPIQATKLAFTPKTDPKGAEETPEPEETKENKKKAAQAKRRHIVNPKVSTRSISGTNNQSRQGVKRKSKIQSKTRS